MPEMSKTDGGSEKKKNTAVIIMAVALVVVIIALITVLVIMLGNTGDAGNTQEQEIERTERRDVTESARLVLDESSAENVMEEMRKEVEEGMFECSMSTEWSFEDGDSESKDAYIANTVNNRHPFYFDVVLDGSDEVIYSSPVLPVGSQLTGFKLDKPLSAGTYEALCKYVLLDDEENQEPISTANFVVTITVLN